MSELYEAVRSGIDKMNTSVHRLAENHNEFAQRLVALEQSKGDSAVFSGARGGKSMGDYVYEALNKDGELFRKTGRLSFEVKAATDPVIGAGAAGVGSIATLPGIAVPGVGGYGLQAVLPSNNIAASSQLQYTRYSGSVEGAAGVQAGEGTLKGSVRPVFEKIVQNQITIAGLTAMSEQAANDRSELTAAINGVLMRQLHIALDELLIDGAVDPAFEGFESLATDYTSAVYTALVDAISEGVSVMQDSGLVPQIVALNPGDWLAIVTAKATGSGEYLSGSYLGMLPTEMRGLKVAISGKVTAGKALLIDPAFCQWYAPASIAFEAGRINDDFSKNIVRLRAEMSVLPVFRMTGAARLITPKP